MKMPIKQLIIFFLIFTLGFSFVYYRGLEVQKHKKRTPLSQASIQSSMAITIPYLFFPNTSADANQVNSDFGTVVNDGVNTVINDIASLFTDATQKGNNETITGAWIFSNGITTNLNNDNDVILDSDNAMAETSRLCYSVNRGSTSANDPAICWTTGTAKIVTDRIGLTLDKLQVANGASGNDVVTWQQVVKNTGNESIGGDKSATGNWIYSNAITQNVAATSANHLMRKGEVEAADSAITAGGCSLGIGAPVGACTHGACYWDETDVNDPIHYFCNSGMAWVKQDIDTINHNLAINGNVTLMSGITFNGNSVELTNIADPMSAQSVATQNYVLNNTFSPFGTGVDGDVVISSNTTLTMDMYYHDLTVNSGVKLTLNGFRIFGTGTLSWNGQIDAGTCSASATGSTACQFGTPGGASGTNMGNGSPGIAAGEALVNNAAVDGAGGGAGGNSGYGAGAAGGNPTGLKRKMVIGDPIAAISAAVQGLFANGPATGGGGGGAYGTDGSTFGGAGGKGGDSAPTAQIVFRNIVYGASSSATGTGQNGAAGGGCNVGGGGTNAGGGGGGGGGSGPLFEVISTSFTGAINSTVLTGGMAGLGSAGCGASNGSNGADGPTGAFVQVDI